MILFPVFVALNGECL